MSATRSLKRILNLHKTRYGNFTCQLKRSASSVTQNASPDEDFRNLKPFSEVPGPRNYPLVGVIPTMLFGKDPKFNKKKINDYWKAMVKKHGRIFYMKLPGTPDIVAIADADEFQKVYKETMDEPIRNAFFSLKKIRDEAVDNYFEKKGGLLTENNEEWWRVRSKVQTPMMNMRNIAKYLPQLDEVNVLFMDRISVFQKQHGEMPADFLEELYKWSLESVGLVALSRRLGCFDQNLLADSIPKQMIENVNLMFGALNETEMNIRWWKLYETKPLKVLREAHNSLLRIVLEAIKETEMGLKNKPPGEDDTLLETFLKTDGLTKKDVVTIILDMFFAGIDTTSHTVAFVLYCLARNKDAQKKLQAELDSVLGDGEQPITDVHLAKLSFLKSCVKETMRLFPITVGHVRTLTKDIAISGYHVPKGLSVFMMACVTSTDEEYFVRPNEFLPDRWERDRPLGKIHPFASIPFSHGSRMCIGRRIAEQEIYGFLARAFHRYNVDYKYKDIDYVTKLVSLPSEPLKFEFHERKR